MITCISCDVDERCLYSSAKFAPDGEHFVLECMGPDFPRHYLMHTANQSVIEGPEQLATVPYVEGWLLKIKISIRVFSEFFC